MLNKLLRKGAPKQFQLSEEQLKSFKTLMPKICSPPFLALSLPKFPCSVDTEGCAYRIGYIMFQTHDDGSLKPIGN